MIDGGPLQLRAAAIAGDDMSVRCVGMPNL